MSVIVPVLDGRETIEAALASALSAQDVAIEVIVIDDGSQDGTPEIATELDERVRVLFTGNRGSGPSYARNIGLASARGEWVALLDADDRFAPGRLESLLRAASAWDADLVVDDVRIEHVDQHSSMTTLFRDRRFPISRPRTLTTRDLVGYDLGLLQPLVHRSLLERHGIYYRARGRASEDFAFLFDCVRAAQRPVAVPDCTYVYVKQSNSVSSARPSFWLDSLSVTAELLRDHSDLEPLERHTLERRMRSAENRYHYLKARRELTGGHTKRAISTLLRHPGATALATRASLRRVWDGSTRAAGNRD